MKIKKETNLHQKKKNNILMFLFFISMTYDWEKVYNANEMFGNKKFDNSEVM